jgi:Uncharacterised protein family (UPF0160)
MSSLGKGPWTTKLSSAGLVYAFYGKDAIKGIVKTDDDQLVDMVYAKVIFSPFAILFLLPQRLSEHQQTQVLSLILDIKLLNTLSVFFLYSPYS